MPATSQARGWPAWRTRRAGCERIASQEIASWSTPRSRGDVRAAGEPVPVSLEFHAELVVIDAQITVTISRNCPWHHDLHFLGDHADKRLVAAEIAEAVETDAVVELPEQHDVVLQHDVGAPATTAAAATAAASATAEASSATAASGTHATAGSAGTGKA